MLAHSMFEAYPSMYYQHTKSTLMDTYINDGFANGEDIITDHIGECIRGFSSSYGPSLTLEVKLRAIMDRIY